MRGPEAPYVKGLVSVVIAERTQYLVVVSKIVPFDGKTLQPLDVYHLMMEHHCWEYSSAARIFPRVVPGDRLVFYLTGKQRGFAGEARVAGPPHSIEARDQKTFDRDQVPYYSWRLPLDDIVAYGPGPDPVSTLKSFSFAKDNPVRDSYPGLMIRNGIRRLEPEDLELLRKCYRPA